MLNRTLLLSFIAIAVCVPLLFSTSSSAFAGEDTFTFESSVILGQSHSQKSPTVFDRFKQGWNNFWQDDGDRPEPRNDHRSTQPAQPAVTVQPPKPLTHAEIQQSATMPAQGRATTTSPSRQGNSARQTAAGRSVAEDAAADDDDEKAEASVYEKMSRLRNTVFNPSLERAAHESRQMSTRPTASLSPSATPLPSSSPPSPAPVQDPWAASNHTVRNNMAGNNTAGAMHSFPELPEVVVEPRQPMPRGDRQEIAVPNPTPISATPAPRGTTPMTASEQAAQRIRDIEAGLNAPPPPPQHEAKRVVIVSPQLEVNITKPPAPMLGQEVTFQIEVTNTGNVPAEQVELTSEIPAWIDVRQPETDAGKAIVQSRGDGSGVSDLTWRISRIESGAKSLLFLRLVPQQRRSIELHFGHTFLQPTSTVKVEVQEPILEMELLGADEVLWDADEVYTLLVRNIGNGNAENLKLMLLQTNSEAAQCEFEEPLAPGEEQPIAISVRAGKEQEYIDIAVQASGAHDLKKEVKRRIRVLRPKLEMSVQTLALHFVDNPAECTIRVRNVGNADAENITIRAELPLGAQYDSSSDGGMCATQQQQNVVEWRKQSIARGETLTYSLTCIPKREGECRISVEASELNGSVMTARNSTFVAEAVTELDLIVNRPRGHVEQGQEAEYTIEVTNVGTKSAEDVEVSMAFGLRGGNEPVVVLEPIKVTGHNAKVDDNGMVVFEKIPVILPKQRVELKVIAKAEHTGAVQVKTQVTGKDIPGLGYELSTTVTSRRGGAATASGQSSQNEFR